MGKCIDLTGQRFGRLTVIEYAGAIKNLAHWVCKCDCGKICVVNGVLLRRGYTQSCGCLRRDRAMGFPPKHGMKSSRIYNAWSHIKTRCYNESCHDYLSYGGRGITMFAEWIDDFQAFYKYVSQLPHYDEPGYSLDRIDNNGNYEPNNLRWATMEEQSRNRRSNVVVNFKGEMLCLKEAAERSGIKYMTLFQRYHRGWRGEKLFQPVS